MLCNVTGKLFLLKKTMIIAAVLAAATVTQDGAAEAASRFRGRQHHATHVRASVHRGYRHLALRRSAYGARRHADRRDAAIRSPRAANLIRRYVADTGSVQEGRASFYSGGGRTANGGVVGSATCAHRSLPFGTKVLVTNLANARQAILTVNDRGPFARGRVLDVSRGAAGLLGMLHAGVSQIRMQVLGSAG